MKNIFKIFLKNGLTNIESATMNSLFLPLTKIDGSRIADVSECMCVYVRLCVWMSISLIVNVSLFFNIHVEPPKCARTACLFCFLLIADANNREWHRHSENSFVFAHIF